MTVFRIGCLQLDISGGDSLDKILKEIRTAKAIFTNLDMIVFGELATHGVDMTKAEPKPGPTEDKFAALAKELGIWIIPGSMFESDGDKVYNTASVINPTGEVVARYRKMFPWFPFEAGTEPGSDFVVFDVPDVGRIGLSICYDSSFPEVARGLSWLGAEVIINVTATYTHDRPTEHAMSRANGFANHCYVLDICNCGRLGNGRSIIVGPEGEVIYEASATQEVMPIAVDFARVRSVRKEGAMGLSPHFANLSRSKVKFPQFGMNELAPSPYWQKQKDDR